MTRKITPLHLESKSFPWSFPSVLLYSVSMVKIDLSVISSNSEDNGDSEVGKEVVIWEWAVG